MNVNVMEKLNLTNLSENNENFLAVTSISGFVFSSSDVTSDIGAVGHQNGNESNNYSSCSDDLPELREIGLQGIAMVRFLFLCIQ